VLIYIGALFGDLSVHDELEKMNTYPGAKNEGSRCPKKKKKWKIVFLGNLFFGREPGVGNGGRRPSSLDLDVCTILYT